MMTNRLKEYISSIKQSETSRLETERLISAAKKPPQVRLKLVFTVITMAVLIYIITVSLLPSGNVKWVSAEDAPDAEALYNNASFTLSEYGGVTYRVFAVIDDKTVGWNETGKLITDELYDDITVYAYIVGTTVIDDPFNDELCGEIMFYGTEVKYGVTEYENTYIYRFNYTIQNVSYYVEVTAQRENGFDVYLDILIDPVEN